MLSEDSANSSSNPYLRALRPWVSAERYAKLASVVQNRSRSIVPVLCGVSDTGNSNAVMRTTEALGLLQLEIIESSLQDRDSGREARGADKWLEVRRWREPIEGQPARVQSGQRGSTLFSGGAHGCMDDLKARGYEIWATTLSPRSVPLDTLKFNHKIAVLFGNEKEGVPQTLLDRADVHVQIPMAGLTQSFNISVAAALLLGHIQNWRKQNGGIGDLSLPEQERLLTVYLARSVPNPERLLPRIFSDAGLQGL
jgi:tRNA (guanosine-2'-O-)-methyltransferase